MSASVVEIAVFRADDRRPWEQLWRAYLDFYHTTLGSDVYDNTWHHIVGGNGPVFAMGLRLKDHPHEFVGLAHYFLQPSAWSLAMQCCLQDLFVAPEHRRRGYAAMLIDSVAEEALRLKCEKLYWHTHEENIAARSLYDSLATFKGFIRYDYRLEK
jgi:GNAT superfamily N-acetyltransferase